MAGEFLVVNPRGRRRRKRARSRARRRSTHRRRRRTYAVNPRPHVRRRRRRHTRRHRRIRRNPGIGGGGLMGKVTKGLTIGAGAVATNVATNFIAKYLPPEWQSGPAKLGIKAGVGLIVLPTLLKFIPGGRKFAGPVMIGAGVVIALDIWTAYIAPNVPFLSDYEMTGMGEYTDASAGFQLGDAYSSSGPGEEGMGYRENIYADTMY